MKSIFKLSALALLATAMTVSCEREMAVEDVVAHQMERHTFTLAFAQPDTKLAITNEGKTTWEVGDEIMIHGGTDGKLRQKVTLTADDISADGKKATITFEMDPYDRTDAGVVSKFYAQYPASLVPEGAMYYECRFTGTNAPLMAACDVNDTFVFYNLCGIITFEADGEFDKFVFAGNGGETVGYSSVYQVRVRLDSGNEAPSVNYYKPGNGSGDPVAMKEFAAAKIDGVNYIYLPVGTNFSEGFNFKFYDGEELVKVAKTTTAVNVAAGKILALGDITGKLETYTPPTTSDHEPAEWAASATDLSVGLQAPANTYVLTAPGAYKIPAVKGNTTEAVGNVFDVELVWETYNNTEEVVKNSVIAEVDFDNDNLYFKTPDALKSGNALIAAKDYEGKIIWSWHIWIPSTAITTVEANGMFGTDVMDRNLGALTAVSGAATAESAGFLYQWGRKDPFMGVGAMAANTSTAMTTTGTFTKSTEQISVTTALANPTMFAYNGATAVDPDWKGLNWCTAENGDAWGTAEEKGVYDPCPAGYRVPAYNSSLPGWAKEDWTYDEANFYYKYSDAIFPFAGYLDDCSGSLSHGGDRSAFWSGTAYNADKGYSVDVRFKSGAATHNVTSQYKARGNSVRCVKINGWVEPQPPTPSESFTDVLNNANTVNESSTTYRDWTTEAFESGAVYAGDSAGDASTIQLRSDVKNGLSAGFVSTATGGLVKKVKVTWNTKTTATRYIEVYGSNTAYTATADLYDVAKRGTLLGVLTYASAEANVAELTVSGDYAYVGVRSRKSAQYLDSVEITWETGTPAAAADPSYKWDFGSAQWQALFAGYGEAGDDITGWNIVNDGMQIVSVIDKSKYQVNCFQMGGKVNVTDNIPMDRYFAFTAPKDGYVLVVASNTGESADDTRLVTVFNDGAAESKIGGVASTEPVSLVYQVKAGKVTVYPTGNGLRFYKILFSETDPTPVPVNITVDGDMSDWAAVEGAATPSAICKEQKVWNDEDNFYLYVSSAPGSRGAQLWGEAAGYYYFDFDLDNDPATGENAEGSRGNFESFMYLYLFNGSAEAPVIAAAPSGGAKGMVITDIAAAGVITDELIEIELSVPRANLPAVAAGQTIRVVSWRSKDGTVIEQTYQVQ